jgi:fructose 1,6-bisphosphatase
MGTALGVLSGRLESGLSRENTLQAVATAYDSWLLKVRSGQASGRDCCVAMAKMGSRSGLCGVIEILEPYSSQRLFSLSGAAMGYRLGPRDCCFPLNGTSGMAPAS